MLFPDYAVTYSPSDFKSVIFWRHHIKLEGTPRQYDDLEKAVNALLTFTSKQEYLDWVSHWKTHYKALVEAQKALKKEIHKPHIITRIYDKYDGWICTSSASSAQSSVACNKGILSALIYLRQMGKKKSWKMKSEQK